MTDMRDKVVIVTGAASGQGAAEARLFAGQGAKVALTDINGNGATLAADLGSAGHFVRHPRRGTPIVCSRFAATAGRC
jgi:3alpha(or 20beta)-hydroxysteroid dehydrogenase